MARQFVPFDEKAIDKEFDALPTKDEAKLSWVMQHFENTPSGNPRPALIEDYGDGVKCIRHENDEYQGRCLYAENDATGEMVILLIYKKESKKMPKNKLWTAKERWRAYKA